MESGAALLTLAQLAERAIASKEEELLLADAIYAIASRMAGQTGTPLSESDSKLLAGLHRDASQTVNLARVADKAQLTFRELIQGGVS